MDALETARRAWRQKLIAESQVCRLRGYGGRLSPGMKDDLRRHEASLREAEATLARVLGGAA